jgi:uncharacterized membrane protein YbhN (UPF0104 family)
MMQALQFLWNNKQKILGVLGFIAVTILQQKAIDPSFLTLNQTVWLTIFVQLTTGGAVAGGIAYSVNQAKNAAPPPPPGPPK